MDYNNKVDILCKKCGNNAVSFHTHGLQVHNNEIVFYWSYDCDYCDHEGHVAYTDIATGLSAENEATILDMKLKERS